MPMPWHIEEQAVGLLLSGLSNRAVERMIGVNEITLRRLIVRRPELHSLPFLRRIAKEADTLADMAAGKATAAAVERMLADAGAGSG